MITRRTPARCGASAASSCDVSVCQKAVGRSSTDTRARAHSATNRGIESIMSSPRSTSVAPCVSVQKISSTEMSKLIDENCNTRSAGPIWKISDATSA